MVIPEFEDGVHKVSDGLVVEVRVAADIGRHVAQHGPHLPPPHSLSDLPPGGGRGEVPARQCDRPRDWLHVQEVTRDHLTLGAHNLGGDLPIEKRRVVYSL